MRQLIGRTKLLTQNARIFFYDNITKLTRVNYKSTFYTLQACLFYKIKDYPSRILILLYLIFIKVTTQGVKLVINKQFIWLIWMKLGRKYMYTLITLLFFINYMMIYLMTLITLINHTNHHCTRNQLEYFYSIKQIIECIH